MSLGGSQTVLDVIRQSIKQNTRNGAMYRFAYGVAINSSAYLVSAYIGASEYASDYIEVPAGSYVSAGDYIVVSEDGGGRRTVDKVLPYTLYSRLALDFKNRRILLGDGLSEPNAGNYGETFYSGGSSASAYWGTSAAGGGGVSDAELLAIAGLTSAADRLPYFTGSGTAALATFTAFGRSLVDDADNTAAKATLGLVIGTNVQAWDADLDALAALAATAGMVSRTGAGAFAVRTITAGTGIGVTNGDGSAGNPTVAVTDAELLAVAGLTSAADSVPYFTGLGTAALATLTTFGRSLIDDADNTAAKSTLGLIIGTNVQAWDADLDAIAGLAATAGMLSRTGAGSFAARTLTAPAEGLTITNPTGSGGNPTFALANDTAAMEALTGTGIPFRTGTDAWSIGVLPDVQIFSTPGAATWTRPTTATAQTSFYWMIAGGGGGASGRRGAAASSRGGGGAGGGGSVVSGFFKTGTAGATISVTIGAGGTGGAAVNLNDTSGNAGVDGGDTIFGSMRTSGGKGGAAGTNVGGGAGGLGGTQYGMYAGGAGGAGTLAAGAGDAATFPTGSSLINNNAGVGGGGGAGISAADVSGPTGGNGGQTLLTTAGGTGAIVAGSVVAVAGTTPGAFLNAGTGGGGGVNATAGTKTGKDGGRGSGGGGGSAGVNASNSGAGGNGGDGYLIVVSW